MSLETAVEQVAFVPQKNANLAGQALSNSEVGACLEGNGAGWYLQRWTQDAGCSSASTGAAALSVSASPARRMFPARAACRLAPAAAVGVVLI